MRKTVRAVLLNIDFKTDPSRVIKVLSAKTKVAESIFAFLLSVYALFLQLSVKNAEGLPYLQSEQNLYLILSVVMLIVAGWIIFAQESLCFKNRCRANLVGACLWGGVLALFFYDQPLSTAHGTYGGIAVSQLIVSLLLLWKAENTKAFPCPRNGQICKYHPDDSHKAE